MHGVMLQMGALVVAGVLWRRLEPGGLSADTVRRVLSGVVFHLLLPALVMRVLWKAPLTADTARIAGSAVTGIAAGLCLGFVIYRLWRLPRAVTGAMLLAATFGNITYFGLPVLQATYGEWAREVAIVYDLFASTPLLFTLGVALARGHAPQGPDDGESARRGVTREATHALLRTPALWGAVLAVTLNATGVPLPRVLDELFALAGAGVVPLMIFAVGLALRLEGASPRALLRIAPTVLLRLLLVPAVVLGAATLLGTTGELRAAITLEAGMPTMVLGLVLCDRYGLDTSLYALAVTVSTALSALTLPLWQALAG